MPFALPVLDVLLDRGDQVQLILSSGSDAILADETGLRVDLSSEEEALRSLRVRFPRGDLRFHGDRNLYAPVASGSYRADGMFVVPCSMKTLAAIATGLADNLIHRAADVALKEGRPLILCPRETPLSAIHLENMTKLARLGVRIVPPVPAFYHRPASVDELIAFVAGKLLDAAGVENDLYRRWGGDPGTDNSV